jgi:DNA polymerase-4/protein ImuB
MPLPEALSRRPGATLLEADMPRDKAVFDRLLDSLEKVSPLVEGAELGLAYVGLDGLEELYGGERAMLAALDRATVPYEAGIGVGEAKFTAYLAAQNSGPGRYVAADGPVRQGRRGDAFLRDFPVDVLPLPWKTLERLRSFGIKTLGEVARLSPGPLQAQLGPDGLLAWELSSGIDRRPLLPRRSEEVVTESLTFPSPAVSIEPILLAVEALLARGFRRPQVKGRYVRAVSLEARVSRGAAFVQRVAFKEPAGDALQAYQLIKPRLLNIQLPGPLDDLSATLLGLTGESGRQASLLSDVRRRDSLRETLRQLEVRLGQRPPIYRVREVEPWSRIPERRRALVEYVP